MFGPLLDQIDIHAEVSAASYRELTARKRGTSSTAMREQVSRSRAKRFGGDFIASNARMNSRRLKQF